MRAKENTENTKSLHVISAGGADTWEHLVDVSIGFRNSSDLGSPEVECTDLVKSKRNILAHYVIISL